MKKTFLSLVLASLALSATAHAQTNNQDIGPLMAN